MLTIKVQKSKIAAEKYMEDHLSKGDYFSEGEDVPSQQCDGASQSTDPSEHLIKYYNNDLMRWHGDLVQQLKIDSQKTLSKKQFSLLLKKAIYKLKCHNVIKSMTTRAELDEFLVLNVNRQSATHFKTKNK